MSEITPTACPQPERSELRTRIATGELSAAQAILTCPSEIGGMPVAQLLASQRGWDESRSRAFLAQAAVNEDKSLGSLTERQRRAIASLLTRTGIELEQRPRTGNLEHKPRKRTSERNQD